jgi:hypothetical protein
MEKAMIKVLHILLALILLLLAGCGTASPRILSEYGIRRTEPVSSSLVVAPVVVEHTPAGNHEFNIDPDCGAIQKNIASALRMYSFFQKVNMISTGDMNGAGTVYSKAAHLGGDYLMTIRFNKMRAVYNGTNFIHYPNCVLWFLLEGLSWFVADEVYSADIGGEVVFTNVADKKVVYTLPFSHNPKCSLSDFQRGVQIWGILRVPGSLDRDSWQWITDVVLPHALRDLEASLLKNLLTQRSNFIKTKTIPTPEPPTPKPPVKPAVRPENYAVIIGVSAYKDPDIPGAKFAESDAEKYSNALSGRKGLNFPEKNVTSLIGANALRSEITRAIAALVEKDEKELDHVYVYFAGCGANTDKEGDRFYLLPHDASKKDLAVSAIELAKLLDELKKLKTDKIVLVIDAGFTSAGGSRSLNTGAEPGAFSEKLLLVPISRARSFSRQKAPRPRWSLKLKRVDFLRTIS